jgi:hypothetical protein
VPVWPRCIGLQPATRPTTARLPPSRWEKVRPTYTGMEVVMRILNIVTSPRRDRSASIAVIDSFVLTYRNEVEGVVIDTMVVWAKSLPGFGTEAIGAKYKGISGEAMAPLEGATWETVESWRHDFKRQTASLPRQRPS